MEYTEKTVGGLLTITMDGRFTFNDHSRMKNIVQLVIKENLDIVLEVSGLIFIDSAAIGMLLILREELANIGRKLVVKNPVGQVARVLTVASINKLINIEGLPAK